MLEYFRIAGDLLDRLEKTQAESIGRAAAQCATSIGSGKLVHLFGTGHGSFPALEAFHRSGSLVGFHPIAELPITLIHHVYGDMGVPQYRFLHRQEGYGRAILEGHRLDPADTLVLFSHSGINPVVLDMALMAKEKGLAVIGVTSLPHSSATASRHSSKKKRFEVADIVIDTGAPLGDACVRIDGLADPVGAVSSMLVMTSIDAVIAETAPRLVERGAPPHVEGDPHLPREGPAPAPNHGGRAQRVRRPAPP